MREGGCRRAAIAAKTFTVLRALTRLARSRQSRGRARPKENCEDRIDQPDFYSSIVFLAILAFIAWRPWYRDIASVHLFRVSSRNRMILFTTPFFCLVLILGTLTRMAAPDVRASLSMISFYLVLGLSWVRAMTLLFPLWGISARDDVLERGNRAATWAVAGSLIGACCSFAGANVGKGPGAHAVLFSAALSTTSFFGLWWGVERLTILSDKVTVDRDDAAAARLGGLLVGIGLLSGWSVAGDWASASRTLGDFAWYSWPAILLAASAVVAERFLYETPPRESARVGASLVTSAAYVVAPLIWIAARGVGS